MKSINGLPFKPFFGALLLVVLAGGAGYGGAWLFWNRQAPKLQTLVSQRAAPNPGAYAAPYSSSRTPSSAADVNQRFVQGAQASSPSVVFIRTVAQYRREQMDEFWSFWDFFGGFGNRQVSSAGSGVIISQDGYIVTNYHVVDQADQITVTLQDKRSYTAEVVGSDPNTDLALLKVEAEDLPPIALGNSDEVAIGEWVLAVGNPLNLTSTITAGIVSARGRNINIVNSQFPIESFIQTDAAINPGNSGGALVNLKGELVGINTAIKSKTGAYSGYGFAIPANVVMKVVKDLREFGEVQRAFAEMTVEDLSSEKAAKLKLEDLRGVLVTEVGQGGPADRAGLRPGDRIVRLDGLPINSRAEYYERLALHRPGEKLQVAYLRKGKTRKTELKLVNRNGAYGAIKVELYESDPLGAKLAPLTRVEKQKYDVEGGYRIVELKRGRLARLGLKEGFTILTVNRQTPSSPQELEKLILGVRGRLIIEGVNADGARGVYSFIQY